MTVVAVGRLRAPFADAVAHYEKLLSRYVRLEVMEVDDEARVARRIPDRAHVVLLDAGGTARSSVELSGWLEDRRQSGRDLALVIGGPYGVAVDSDERLSLGPLTLPFQLCRVVLLEQLYRAHKILANEPYHH